MAGLYIHIPFCGQLCSYCDFHFSLSLSRIDDMIESIKRELTLKRDYLNGDEIKTLYFGGGTPSLLSAMQLKDIAGHASAEFNFDISSLQEFTVECNPEDLSLDYLKSIKDIGVSRLSIGIQSFNDTILAVMNRRHTSEKAREVVRNAREVGFDNISIDLIFGVPECSDKMLIYDLDEAILLNTEHISVYHLTIEDKTILGWKRKKGVFSPVEDIVSDSQYKIVEKKLQEAGFIHYEVSNYSKEGKMAKHNSSYWNGTPYIGIGPSAHSFDGRSRQWNIAGNIRYIEAVDSGKIYFEKEYLSDIDRYNEYIMTSLRTKKGISKTYIEKIFGSSFLNYFNNESKSAIENGMLLVKGDYTYIESSNFLLSDSLITDLMMVSKK